VILALLVEFIQALVYNDCSVNETKTEHPKDDTHDEFSQNTGRSGIHEGFQAVIYARVRFYGGKEVLIIKNQRGPLDLLIPELPAPFREQWAKDLAVILTQEGNVVFCEYLEEVLECQLLDCGSF
jgi:hypothetical protein